MSAAFFLLGPPELCYSPPPPPSPTTTTIEIDPHPIKSLTHHRKRYSSSDDELSDEYSDYDSDSDDSMMGLTENNSATYLSSRNPCLDFFFHVVPDTRPEELIRRLESAWSHNPLTALKLVCNLRAVRGTGKSDREGFYTAALWLHQHHPKTLACNVKVFADFGCLKDLPEILYRILEGSSIRKIQKHDWERKLQERKFSGRTFSFRRGRDNLTRKKYGVRQKTNKRRREIESKRVKRNEERLERIQKNLENMKLEKEKASSSRKEKEMNKARKALDKYYLDENYRILYDMISDCFVEFLKADLEKLTCGKLKKISLASKWCPSVDSSYDKATLICESVARKMFPKENHSEYEGLSDPHYVYRVRDRLRKEVLVPLHKALELPEVFMGANQWNELPYNRVASVAMTKYKELFLDHDGQRFNEYLDKVKKGEAKIASEALLPHEIIKELDNEEASEVAELQWKRMVDDLLAKGKLKNCLAISDVSGSMNGTPMEVSVALGVLVSELSEEPWKGKLITFSQKPELQEIKGDTLKSKTSFVREMESGYNTNFQRVFHRILRVAVEEKLSEERMVKRLFVFSDMEFDQASDRPWETDYQAIQRKFKKKGYQNVPEIVFWNLRASRSTPVLATQSGVALVSGFSKNLMKVFLEGDGIVNPEQVMERAISREEYNKLAVFD